MKYQLARKYFLDPDDGNELTTEERINDALKLLKNEDDYIDIDGAQCRNKEELYKALGL